MMKTKRKAKSKPGLKNWKADLTPVAIDFIAYLPLEECVDRLENLDKHSWWRSIKTYVTITPIDDASYAFHIKRKTSVLDYIEAKGCLHAEVGTSVKGEVVSPAISHPAALFVLYLTAGLYVIVFSRTLEVLVCMLIELIIDVFTRLRRRYKLAEVIEMALGYKSKQGDSLP